jgi:hypothetical protein
MAGYSGTPLAKKLGIKEGFVIKLINEPEYYFELFSDMPEIEVSDKKGVKKNMVHFFTKSLKEYHKLLPQLRKEITEDGMIWVSWPKKAAKIETDVTENAISDLVWAEAGYPGERPQEIICKISLIVSRLFIFVVGGRSLLFYFTFDY